MQRDPFSKAQIDRLGNRLKAGTPADDDLRLLDDYRRTFGGAYEEVFRTIQLLGKSPTGRSAKSTTSIVEKLKRETIRLSQVQDIAGCRVVVTNILEQDFLVRQLGGLFSTVDVIDRRIKPSHGYRAVHVVVRVRGRHIEIQVRTALQHLWAEISEKSSDVLDPSIKYGGGPELLQSLLASSSDVIASQESFERQAFETPNMMVAALQMPTGEVEPYMVLKEHAARSQAEIAKLLLRILSLVGAMSNNEGKQP